MVLCLLSACHSVSPICVTIEQKERYTSVITDPPPTEHAEALRQQLEATTRQAESLRRVIESISGELALAPLLDRILESAVELLAVQHGAIGLVAETSAGPAIRIAAIFNMPPHELGAEHPVGVGLAGRVLRDQRPIQLER